MLIFSYKYFSHTPTMMKWILVKLNFSYKYEYLKDLYSIVPPWRWCFFLFLKDLNIHWWFWNLLKFAIWSYKSMEYLFLKIHQLLQKLWLIYHFYTVFKKKCYFEDILPRKIAWNSKYIIIPLFIFVYVSNQ